MGNRVMHTPNLRGRTVARQLIPRSVRQSQKRARRQAANVPKLAPLVQPLERVVVAGEAQLAPRAARRSWKQVLGIAAKTAQPAKPIEQKQPVREPALASQAAPPPSQLSPKPVPAIAAKTQEPATQFTQTQPRELAIRSQTIPSVAQPSQIPAPPIPAKPKKRAKPPKPAATKPSEPVVNEAQRDPLDYLKDAVVEWGVKREQDKDSET